MTPHAANRHTDSRPVSSFLERLLDRLPQSRWRLVVSVLCIKFIAVAVTALMARYVTHEEPTGIVLWGGYIELRELVKMVIIQPATDALAIMLLAFLVSWFSPLSLTRATTGQVVIGVGLVFGMLEATVEQAAFFKGAVSSALTAYVYLRYRRKCWRAGASMATTVHWTQSLVTAALISIAQRWCAGA